MSLPVGFFVEAEGLFAVRGIGDDRSGAALGQPLPQLGTVIGLVGEQLLGGLCASDQALSGRAVMCLATGQEDGKKTAFSICECVDLRVAPSTRATDRLFLLPPFPPAAERCVLMCVESII